MSSNKKLSAQQAVNSSGTVTKIEGHSGPMPTPSDLEKYEKILPGMANQLLQMSILEQKERHKLSSQFLAVESNHNRYSFINQLVGQIFAFVIVVLFLGLALYGFMHDKEQASVKILGYSLTAVAGLFIISKVTKIKPQQSQDNSKVIE